VKIIAVVGASPPPLLGAIGGVAFLAMGLYTLSKTERDTTGITYVAIVLYFVTGALFLYHGVRGVFR
jgi:hypothetical protein